MRKVVYNQYGNVEVLSLQEVNKPVPNDQQLLIKIKSVSITPFDWKVFLGKVKMISGSKFPKYVGSDFAGIVESTGRYIQNFKRDDEVFGTINPLKDGALGEYLLVDEKQIAVKPKNLSFEHAAALPTAGQTAMQMLSMSNIAEGQEILINGASGGVGMFAIQLAKRKGAIVTAVASAKGHDLLKKWGSDFIIDYNKEKVTDINRQYDVILELSGKLPYSEGKKLLKRKATYITAVPTLPVFITSFFHNLFSKKKYKFILTKPDNAGLKSLAAYAAKDLDIHISGKYPITAYKEAYEKVIKEGSIGKAIINVPS